MSWEDQHEPRVEMIQATHLVAALFFLVTFFIGIVGNSLYIWILGFKIKKTVNTVWVLNLVMAYWTFTIIMPFFSVNVLIDTHWVFGRALCKLLGMLGVFCMYASVLILMIISLDRYLSIMHPLWARRYRTTKRALAICGTVWIVAFVLSGPYLAIMDTRLDVGNKILCFSNYALSEDWNGTEVHGIRSRVQWSMFLVQVIFGFLLPFMVISSCSLAIAVKMRLKKLTKSRKPFQVIMAAVVSFFVCWMPYHVYQGLALYPEDFSQSTVNTVFMVSAIMSCVNVCCTPILYLFIGQNFKETFKKSILTLIEMAFHDDFDSLGGSRDRTMEMSASAICERRVPLDGTGQSPAVAIQSMPNTLSAPMCLR